MAKVGYARVSMRTQSDDSQVDELLAAGCDPDHLFIDKGVSGKHASRPELDACLAYLRKGDTLVITRLSRAMRSLRHLLELAATLNERGVGLVVLKQIHRHHHPDRAAGVPHPRRDRRIPEGIDRRGD